MRRQLQKFLPVVLIALAVQILAPIAASWAAAATASDPLRAAEICHSILGESSGQTDPGTDQHAHDGACLICCAVQAGAAVDSPQQAAFPVPYRQTTRVIWHIAVRDVSPARTGSNTQARAPPLPL
ncbi:DUF2946 family protein [Bradyrhizobium sp. Tv2a-2]|uniref:DUF2946 family protein n=1 Tax=Bradyrhizobium sp. Tv2a-2 TaxID=113395 RepID=UPI000462FD27|nr:DUF2946 family protein [Bradyrhizobium sp. Tv2a-2]